MNQELLSNPFDAEFQSITEPSGALLREVAEDIGSTRAQATLSEAAQAGRECVLPFS